MLIVVPFVLLYCIIVCIFRACRAKRKAAEQEERRKAMQSANTARTETEMSFHVDQDKGENGTIKF